MAYSTRSCCSRPVEIGCEKWAENVNAALFSPRGRRKFRGFLVEMGLEEDALIFWQEVHSLQEEKKKKTMPRNVLKERIKRLYKFADQGGINFDVAEMRKLRRLLHATPEEEDEILEQAKQSAAQLLVDDHKHFSEWIFQNYS